MKINRTISCALAVALTLVAGKASADLALSASGSAVLQKTRQEFTATTESYSINNKVIYNIISNALSYASFASAGAIGSTSVPANGYIAFNPIGYDGVVNGTFYVTNKTGFYCPLSGFDTNDNYYSFMELDTTIYYDSSTNGPYDQAFYFGFYYFDDYLYQGVASYSISKTGSGSDTCTSKALLYVHDFPYDYGDPNGNDGEDYYPFDDANDNAFEIGGVLTTSLTIKDSEISGGSLSLTGSGNFILYDYEIYGVLTSGHASFSQ